MRLNLKIRNFCFVKEEILIFLIKIIWFDYTKFFLKKEGYLLNLIKQTLKYNDLIYLFLEMFL